MSAPALIQQRGRIFTTLTKAVNYADTLHEDVPIYDIQVRHDRIEKLWDEFYAVEDALMLFENQTSKADEFESKYFKVKAIFMQAIAQRTIPDPQDADNVTERLNATLGSFVNQQKLQQDTSKTGLKLPKINVECFSGEYADWPSFRDLYVASIHNNHNLSNVHKFQLLKGLLRGNAALLLKHVALTEANYKEAWDKLNSRYNKTKSIINSYIKNFYELPAVHQSNATSLRTLAESADEILRGLKALGESAESRDHWIIYTIMSKLDNDSKQRWAVESVQNDNPTIADFLKFLNLRCDALEGCTINKRPGNRFESSKGRTALHVTTTQPACACCSKPHALFKCLRFKQFDLPTRVDLITKQGLCSNCLRANHTTATCFSKSFCFICQQRHHTLLHGLKSVEEVTTIQHAIVPTPSTNEVPQHTTEILNSHLLSNKIEALDNQSQLNTAIQTVLPTALIKVQSADGRIHLVRAMLDSGSQASFVTERLIQYLGLPRESLNISIKGLSGCDAGKTKGASNILLISRYDNNKATSVKAFILTNLSSKLPAIDLYLDEMCKQQLQGLSLADPEFTKSSKIDILLGMDVFYKILDREIRVVNDRLTAFNTIFGWVIGGKLPETSNNVISCNISWPENDINHTLQRFWQLENVPENNQPSKDDIICEEYFKSNFAVIDGHYNVKLPFRDELMPLGDSLPTATSRMLNMERRFAKNSKLKDEYAKFMHDYESLGHMRRLSSNAETTGIGIFYLPHHAVMKQTSSTTKLRVVFDGSAKSSKNLSLNDNLLVGPSIQKDIFTILLRFRRHVIAFSSDIEKMYRQIMVARPHQNYQRIVWRDEPTEEMKHYCLNTVTYGLSCSAFLAIRSLHQAAFEHSTDYPQAANIITSDFYVDDLLSGSDTIQGAIKLKKDLCKILGNSGFHLRKWSSNNVDFITSLPKEIQGETVVSIEDQSNSLKTLGMKWITSQDIFSFSYPEFNNDEITKRTLLANTSKLFDPIGWLTPVTIRLKVLFQSLWLLNLDWDERLPDNITQKWITFRKDLKHLNKIAIPRRFSINKDVKAIEYHGFCDASEIAYAAVIYARTFDEEGNIYTNLVTSKTKVAPLKQISLPRLELCGALLLAKLFRVLCDGLEIENTNIFAWSDSNIVLSWLTEVPRKWNCFIANRTSTILDILPAEKWRHVPSKSNPADLPSRGTSTANLLSEYLWWNGPPWLAKSEHHWPNQAKLIPTNLEQRSTCLHSNLEEDDNQTLNHLFEKISNFKKIIRILAQCYRFAEKCHGIDTTYPTTIQYKKAKELCLRWAQTSEFKEDIIRIQQNNNLSKTSKLISLNPSLDSSGLVRVGGRLSNSSLPQHTKFPIILPQRNPVTKSLLLSLHQQYLHPNPSTLLYLCRLEYWVIGARRIIKQITLSCPKCYRLKLATAQQLMGQLPAARVLPSKPFLNVGIDYAGPIYTSSRKGRGARKIKSYICLFVCMSTKAIHLELVSEMTTTAFLATFNRFTSRRGLPKNVYSDNGSNFIGAKHKIEELQSIIQKNLRDEQILHTFNDLEINWHMIPPSAPHFGGLWEAGVKSTKNHIKKVIGDTALTFEEMSTLLCQIEAILNSRPLIPLNDDPNDIEILTPGHFLVGSAITSLPANDPDDSKSTYRNRWQLVQNMVRGFWKKWQVEYLTTLQQRPKWQNTSNNFKVDDLVLIKDTNTPALQWPRGRIIAVHPGSDAKVRVVTVKTTKGIIKRPVTKLCQLVGDQLS